MLIFDGCLYHSDIFSRRFSSLADVTHVNIRQLSSLATLFIQLELDTSDFHFLVANFLSPNYLYVLEIIRRTEINFRHFNASRLCQFTCEGNLADGKQFGASQSLSDHLVVFSFSHESMFFFLADIFSKKKLTQF